MGGFMDFSKANLCKALVAEIGASDAPGVYQDPEVSGHESHAAVRRVLEDSEVRAQVQDKLDALAGELVDLADAWAQARAEAGEELDINLPDRLRLDRQVHNRMKRFVEKGF